MRVGRDDGQARNVCYVHACMHLYSLISSPFSSIAPENLPFFFFGARNGWVRRVFSDSSRSDFEEATLSLSEVSTATREWEQYSRRIPGRGRRQEERSGWKESD